MERVTGKSTPRYFVINRISILHYTPTVYKPLSLKYYLISIAHLWDISVIIILFYKSRHYDFREVLWLSFATNSRSLKYRPPQGRIWEQTLNEQKSQKAQYTTVLGEILRVSEDQLDTLDGDSKNNQRLRERRNLELNPDLTHNSSLCPLRHSPS